MERAEKVKQKALDMISRGEKVSASRLAAELNFSEADIHRCLNMLESSGEIRTFKREILGGKIRFVGINRKREIRDD